MFGLGEVSGETDLSRAVYNPSMLRPAMRPLIAAMLLFVAIAIVDVLAPRITVSILYGIPLILVVRAGYVRPLWRFTAMLILLTIGMHFLKSTLYPPDSGPIYLNFRLVNRAFVAVMLWLMAQILQMWVGSDRQRQLELNEPYRASEDENDATLAVLLCIPLALIIALVDLLLPANFNLAILYPIPLLICAWTRNRALLWSTLAVLLLLTAAGYQFRHGPIDGTLVPAMRTNRILSAVLTTAVTVVLHFWIGLSARRREALR